MTMEYTTLGRTGMRVARIALGTATFGVAPAPEDAVAVVHAALDLGITLLDTANVYGSSPTFDRPGAPPPHERESAEEILGRALVGRRDAVVLCTKSGERAFDPDAGLSRRYIMQQVEHSLRRLRTSHIDVYYAHFPDPHTPLDETLAAYDDLIREGKIRHVALSNHAAWQLTEALWIAENRQLRAAPVCAQVKYSLLDRSAERELTHACEHFGVSIVPYAPLHGGLLANLAVLDRGIAGDQRFGGPGFTPAEVAVAQKLDALAREWNLTMPQVALSWLLSRPAVASVIVGAETVGELEANASAAEIHLTPDQTQAVADLTRADP